MDVLSALCGVVEITASLGFKVASFTSEAYKMGMKNISLTLTLSTLLISSLKAFVVSSQFSYVALPNPMSFQEVRTYAESLGGHLATVSSTDEMSLIAAVVDEEVANGSYTAAAIGAYEADNDGSPGLEWNWVTGEVWNSSFESWYPGLTTLNPGGDDFVYLLGSKHWYPWNTNPNNTVGAMILETPVPEPSTYTLLVGGISLTCVFLMRRIKA